MVAQWQNDFTIETIVHVLVEDDVIAGDGDSDGYKDSGLDDAKFY